MLTRQFRPRSFPRVLATGAGVGGAVDGGLGWLAGIGARAISGVGPWVAASPIMAALGGAATGAEVGGLTGAMIGLGIPEYEAKRYEGKSQDGNILVSVHTASSDEINCAKDVLKRAGTDDISTTTEGSVDSERRASSR